MSRSLATTIGFSAILMWAFLALLTALAGPVPPFQLAAMCFAIGGSLALATWPFRPGVFAALKACSLWLWVLGISSLFSYHVFYFAAIQSAPAVEVSLIAYLWPLFMVIFSSFLPGEKLTWQHMAGVLLGLLGAVLVIGGGKGIGLSEGLQTGHFLALPCAVIWALYSVLAKRFAAAPTDVIGVFCLAAAFLSLLAHLWLEPTVWPETLWAWGAVVAMGLFPLGLAFYTWDFGLKRGDIMLLGVLSYMAPLLSTLILLVVGLAPFHISIIAACLLITAGGLVATRTQA